MRIASLLLLFLAPLGATGEKFSETLLEQFKWRELGPANMGGRITDIAVLDSRPQHFLLGAATGGVWRTLNNGQTWTPLFDKYGTASIGDIDLCQSNPDLIWVGTGEANARNSVTPGDGVYKSVDGGKSFKNMGLRATRHIGRVVIHAKAPDTVFVAALGCLYKPSKERGLFRTKDGGETWSCVKFIDEDTGFIDLIADPSNPDTMYAAACSMRRDAFSGSNSPTLHTAGSGLYKTTDGGDTWKRLGKGLPKGPFGRIGIDIYRKDPRVVVAIIETKTTTALDTTPGASSSYAGISGEDGESGVTIVQVVKGGPSEKAGLQAGDIIKEAGGTPIETWQDFSLEIRKRKPGDKLSVTVQRAAETKTVEIIIGSRPEERPKGEIGLSAPSSISSSSPSSSSIGSSGLPSSSSSSSSSSIGSLGLHSSSSSFSSSFGSLGLQDKSERGGVFRSDDGGETWTHLNSLNPRPFYFSQIRIDPLNDQRIWVGGVQLHLSEDGGKRFRDVGRTVHSDHHALWIDPRDSDHVLDGTDGGIYVTWDRAKTWEHLSGLALGQYYAVGLDMSVPYRVFGGLQDNGTWMGPSRTRNGVLVNEDFSFILGGDGFYARVDPTDPNTVYCESQYGMVVRLDLKTRATKSIRPGGKLRWEWNTPIELSPLDPKCVYLGSNKLHESRERGDNSKEISGDLCKTAQGAITTIGPSPVDANVIWVGTNDGGVQVTRDRGATWTDVSTRVDGMPPLLWVTRIEPSRATAGRAYLTVDGRRKDDLATYLWRTDDFGRTWTRLGDGLPVAEPTYVVREDPRNPNLLFVGTERGVYVSIDAGHRWVSLQRNLPVVPVHDLAIHPRDGEIVAATHGRSMWAMDIRPLQEMTLDTLDAGAFLFSPGNTVLWKPGKQGWFGGSKGYRAPVPPAGTTLSYYLREEAKLVALTVLDAKGKQVTKLAASSKAGLHRLPWNLGRGQGRVTAGEYLVVLSVDGLSQARALKLVDDPE